MPTPPPRRQRIINRNEVVQGPSPKALRALRTFSANHANFYFDDYDGSLLAPALAKRFDVPQNRIIVGYGAEYILDAIFSSLDPARDVVLMHELHFDYYHLSLAHFGVPFHEFRLREGTNAFSFDIDDCVAKIRTLHPKLILITSPSNPTGNVITPHDLSRVLRAAPRTSLVVVDEAYYGFNPHYEAQAFMRLLATHPNLMYLRTFSKLYALAGLRIGYALCGKNVRPMIRHRGRHLGGSRVLEEVAVAALNSTPYYRALAKEIGAERDRTIAALNELDHFKAFASHANLIAVKISPEVRPHVERAMRELPDVVFRFYAPFLLRVSIATRKPMDAFLKAMRRADRAAART